MQHQELKLRTLKRTDVYKSGLLVTWPITGLTAEIDGQIAGYAGVHKFGAHHWVFFDVFDDRVRRPFFLHRLVRDVLDGYAASGIGPIYSICDCTVPSARRWHGALGFREVVDAERDDEIRLCEEVNKRGAWVKW